MVSEPVHVAVLKFEIHDIEATEEEADGSSQTRSNGGRSNFARLGDDGVVVDQLVFRGWESQDLGENSVYNQVLRLPGRTAFGDVLELVKGSSALDEGVGAPITVNIDEELCSSVSVEVEDVDSIRDSIP